MDSDRATLREVVWPELVPGLILLRTVRLAIGARVLLLASVAAVLLPLGLRLIGLGFSWSDDPWLRSVLDPPTAATATAPAAAPGEAVVRGLPLVGQVIADGPVFAVWQQIAQPFRSLFDGNLSFVGFVYLAFACLWTSAVCAVAGGAVTRIAALGLARDESPSLGTALAYAIRKFPSYFVAPLLPLVVVLLTFIVLGLGGLLLRADFGLLVAALAWPLVLVAGLILAVMLIGLWIGWPMMAPTISTEGTDAFDALSRTYAYTYQRPLHLLLYVFVASLLGYLGAMVVDVFAAAVLDLGTVGVGWGAGSERIESIARMVRGETEPDGGLASAGTSLLALWVAAVGAVQMGFRYGFFWVASTAIYLLMRRHVDDTEMDEAHLDERTPEYGLPPLETDEAGVPGAADESPSGDTDSSDTSPDDSADDGAGSSAD